MPEFLICSLQFVYTFQNNDKKRGFIIETNVFCTFIME